MYSSFASSEVIGLWMLSNLSNELKIREITRLVSQALETSLVGT